MKKLSGILRKATVCFTCVCMLLCSAPVSVSAVGPDDNLINMGDALSEIIAINPEGQGDFLDMSLRSTVSVLNSLGKAGDAAKLSENAGKWVTLFKNSMNVLNYAGIALTFVNGTVTFLRMLGVIDDPVTSALDGIKSSIDTIQYTVDEMNTKMDNLKSSISSNFAAVNLEFRNQDYMNYQNAWSSFYRSEITGMNQLQALFSDNLIRRVIGYVTGWQQSGTTGLRALYDEEDAQVYSSGNIGAAGAALPACPVMANDGTEICYSVTLPGSYIYGNINRGVYINADNYLDVLTAAVGAGVAEAAGNGELLAGPGFYERWNSLSTGEKEQEAEKISQELLDALLFGASWTTANEGTLVTDVCSRFTSYCDFMCGTNNLTSPLNAQLQMLALTHGFEGEIKNEAAYLFTYFNNLTLQYGEFTAMITALAQNKTDAERTAFRNRWWSTLQSGYNTLDSFITGNNNFCYVLNSTIEYRDIEFSSQIRFTSDYEVLNENTPDNRISKYNYNEDVTVTKPWRLTDLSKLYDQRESQTVYDNETAIAAGMISSDDILLLYGVFRGEQERNATQSPDFAKYLVDCNVAVPKTAGSTFSPWTLNTGLVTGGYQYKSFDIHSGLRMTDVKKTYDSCSYYFEDGHSVTMGSSLEGEDECYVIHDHVQGDLFNLSSGVLTPDTDLVSKVFYGESHWYWPNSDETWALSSGNVELSHTTGVSVKQDGMGEIYFEAKRTQTVDYSGSFSTIVYTTPGTYTVPANVETVGSNLFGTGCMLRSLTFNGTPESIDSGAFSFVGSPARRCILNYPESWDNLSLSGPWNGGYFADKYVTLYANNGTSYSVSAAAASDGPCMNIPCPFGSSIFPEHKKFAGWSRTPSGPPLVNPNVTAGTVTGLYAVWEYDHSFVPIKDTEPTCTQDGLYGKEVCSVCGEIKENGRIIPRTGHSYVYNEVTGESVCSRCGRTCIIESAGAGPFIVTGENLQNTVCYESGSLYVTGETPVTIRNRDFGSPAADRIVVGSGVNADITLAGVNVVRNFSGEAFLIDDRSGSDVCVTLQDGTENVLTGGSGFAGLEADGTDGTLTIYGNGSLTATGGENAAGIGGGRGASVKKIRILGGRITAAGGVNAAGIGGGLDGFAPEIEILRGEVTAVSPSTDAVCGGYVPRTGTAGFCMLTVCRDASLKAEGVNGPDLNAVDDKNSPVYLNVIDNPTGNGIIIDGRAFPYTSHQGENRVYVYLPGIEHSISADVPEGAFFETAPGVTVDYENGWIYGITPGSDDVSDFVTALSGITMNVTYSSSKCGTGTTVEAVCNNSVLGSFTVILFGDVNGDGWYDGTDAAEVSCIAGGMLTAQQAGAAVMKAADCNHDGETDSADVLLLEQAGILLGDIDQCRSGAELLTDSAFAEYLGLIDQNPGTASGPEEKTGRTLPEIIFGILMKIINYITLRLSILRLR